MFKLLEDKSVLSAEAVLFEFGLNPNSNNCFRFYKIKTTKETFRGQPTEKKSIGLHGLR